MFRSKSLLKCSQAIINQQLGNKTSGTSLYKSSNSIDGHANNKIENFKHSLEDNLLRRTNSEINSTTILKKTKSCNFLSQINNLNKTLGNHKVSASCCTLSGYNTNPYLENELFSRITNETKIVYKDRNFNIVLNKKYSVCRSNKYESNKKNSFKYTSCNKLRIAHIQQKQKLNYSRKIKTGPIKKRIQHEKIQIQAYKVYHYVKNVNGQLNVDTIFSYNKMSNTISKKNERNKKILESRTDIRLPVTNIKKHNVLDVNKTPIKLAEIKEKYIQNGSVNIMSNNPVHSSGARAAITLNAEFINRKINILPKYQSYNTITTTCHNAANTLKNKEIKTINSISNEKQYSLNGERNEKVRSVTGEDKFSTISQDDSEYFNNTQESNEISTTNTEEQLSIKDLIYNNTALLSSTTGKDLQINESKKECILTSIYTTPTVIDYDKFCSETTYNGLIESNLSKEERALLSIYSGKNNYFKCDNTSIRKPQSKLYEAEKNKTGASTTKYEKQIENKFIKDDNPNNMRNTNSTFITEHDSKYFSKVLKDSRSITNQNNKLQTDRKLRDNLLQTDKKPVTPEAVAWKRGRNYQQLKSKICCNFDEVINAGNIVLKKKEMESVPWIRGKHYEQIKETKYFKQKNEVNKKGNVENYTDEVGWIKGQNIGESGRSQKQTYKLNYHPNQKENDQMIFSFPINYLKGIRVTNSDTFGFTNGESCCNTTSAKAWMRNKYSKSENNLFNHFHEIKSTAQNNKNYSQAACETNVTTKEKLKYQQINNKVDSKKDLKPGVTWKQSTFRVDEEKPTIDVHGKKLLKLQETNNTDTKFDSMTSKKTNVNERYQQINTNSKHKTVSTAVPWVRNQNTIMKNEIRSEIFNKVGIGKQNWTPNLSPLQSSTNQIKEEQTGQSRQYSANNKINCSLSHHKQPSKHKEAPVPSTFKETKINPNGNNESVIKRAASNKPMAIHTVCEPTANKNKIGSSNNCNETRKNNVGTKSQLLILWKKNDKIKNENEIAKDIADLTEQTNVRPTKTNGQFLSSNKSMSNTLLKMPHTEVAWVRNGCITNKDENHFNCSDNFTKLTKHLHKPKKVKRQLSVDALKNLNQTKMNENNTAVAWEQKLITDQNSFQNIYKSGEAENKIRDGKKIPETNNNIKETSITTDLESKIPLNSETKNIHANDENESSTKKKNSQTSKETITNITKKSFNNNLITEQNLKDSPGKSQSTTIPTTDSISKIKIKISLANAARNCDQIKGDKVIVQPECGIIKLQKQNDQFKKMLNFMPKNQKEGKIKAAYPIDAEEEFKRDKNENIQANDMKGLNDQKKVGPKEELHKNRITLDKTKAFNFKQSQTEDTNNADTESETKKKLKVCLEKNDTSKKDEVKKQNAGETKTDAEEFSEYLTQIIDNKTHAQRMHEFYEFEEKLLGFKKPQTNVYRLDETCQKIEPENALSENITLESAVTSQCNNTRTESSSKLIKNNKTESKFTRGKNSLPTEEQKIAEQNKDSETHDREKLNVSRNFKPLIKNEPIQFNKLCTDKSLNIIKGNETPIKDSNTLISTSYNDKNKCNSTTIGDESTKLTKILTEDGSLYHTKINIKPEKNDFIKQSHYIKKQTEKKIKASEKSAATKIRNRLLQTNSTGQSIIVNEKNYNLPTTETIVRLETTPVTAENLVCHTVAQANKDIKKTDDNNNKHEINPKIFKKVKSQKYNITTKNSEMEQSDTIFTKSRSGILGKEATKLLKNVEKISDQENVSLNINMLKQIYDTGMKELYEGPTVNNLNETNKKHKDSKSQSHFYSDCTKILQNDGMTVYAPNKSISAESILMNNEQNKAEARQVNTSPILKTMLKAVVYTVFNNRNPHDQLIESEMINSKESETIKRKEEDEKEASKKCNSEDELSPWLSNDEANDVENEQDNENQFLMPISVKRFPMINDNKMMFEYPKSPTAKIINYNDEMVYKHVPSVSKILNGTLPISVKKELENWEINHLANLGKTQFKEYYRGQIKNDIQFHDCIRRHILGTPMNILTENANVRLKGCLSSLKGILSKLKNVTVLEGPVVHPVLPYHGIVDCVASYNNDPVLIEWKQADRSRPVKELMYDVPVQLAAYIGAINHDQHYKIPIKSGIIVVAYTDGSPADVLPLTKKQLEENWKIWLERLESYMESK